MSINIGRITYSDTNDTLVNDHGYIRCSCSEKPNTTLIKCKDGTKKYTNEYVCQNCGNVIKVVCFKTKKIKDYEYEEEY